MLANDSAARSFLYDIKQEITFIVLWVTPTRHLRVVNTTFIQLDKLLKRSVSVAV